MGEQLEFEIDHAVKRISRRGCLARERVLYVDDDALMRSAVTRLLRGAEAVCLAADTHDSAVVLLSSTPALDLAILDFQMPDGDVSSLVGRLRTQQPFLPLLGTSGMDYGSEFAARRVVDFLPKPWTLDDLIRVTGWEEMR